MAKPVEVRIKKTLPAKSKWWYRHHKGEKFTAVRKGDLYELELDGILHQIKRADCSIVKQAQPT